MTAHRRRPIARVMIASVFAAAGFLVVAPAAEAAPACDVPANEIIAENCLPGAPPSQWDVSGAGDASIQGFATQMSVDAGQTVHFKVDTNATDYELRIYRLGYYGGNGARLVATVDPSASLPQNQPDCLEDTTTGLVDCGNWAESASWAVPANAVSGVYVAKLNRTDATAGASHIVFVVRDDDGGSDLLFQTSDTTWQAYNQYGGSSLYSGGPSGVGRAYKVSYNRPLTVRGGIPEDSVFNAEFPMIRWLESNGYDVSYLSGVDTDRAPGSLLSHKVFMSVGHDEYWSGGQRANVEAARDAGVHLAFFSGNEIFWKTRWENSIDPSHTSRRTLVSYKETHANARLDPTGTWTGTWRDTRFGPHDGGRPENALSGQIFTVNCCTYAMNVDAAAGQARLWRNTTVQTSSGVDTLPDGTLGYEWDEDLDNGARPAGLIRLSSTTQNVPERLTDFGSTYAPGTATHTLTMYKKGSALVFGAGTVQWSWGLDGTHERGASTPSAAMRQATVNVFADMGVQPDNLQAPLTAATASTDTTAPTVAVSQPVDGANARPGTPLTITGTANGGVIGGVEVTTDNGATWHPANGRNNWTYTITPQVAGTTLPIRARATDDSLNTSAATAARTVNVTDSDPTPSVRTDSSVVEFGAGTLGACRVVAHRGDGEVGLVPATGEEFAGGSLPSGWVANTFDGAGSVSVGSGRLVVDGGQAKPSVFGGPVRSLEFVGTFSAAPFQHFGFADAFNDPPWAMFSTGGDGGSLKVRTDDANGATAATPDFVVPGSWLGSPHRYRIDVLASEVVYSIDGVEVMRHSAVFQTGLRPVASDLAGGGGTLSVDWLDVSPYGSSCVYESAPVDAGTTVDWTTLDVVTATPAGTAVGWATSSSDDGSSWSPYVAVSGSTIGSPAARFLRYRATLSSSDGRVTPEVQSVSVVAAPEAETVAPTTAMLVPANNASVRGTVTLDASASDNVGVAGVEFRATGPGLSDVAVGSGTLTPYGWIASWDTTGLADGTFTVRSRARDAAGNAAFSTPITVKVDNTAPTASMLAPANNAAVKGTVGLDAGAADNNAVTRVEFRATGGALNNRLLGQGTLTFYGWIYQWDTNAVAQNTYQVRAVAFDAAGNTTTSTPISLTVDRTKPVTAIVVPSNDNTTISGNAILDATATDNNTVTKVEFRATGPGASNVLIGTGTLTQYGWLMFWDTTTRANGTYTVKSTAYDAAGNTAISTGRILKINN